MANIQIVLKDDVEKLGKSGELVKVKPGYARNFLFPRGLAAVATRANVAQVEHEKKAGLRASAKRKGDAETVAKKLEGITLSLTVQAGEGDRLFGSIGTKDIEAALKGKGHEVDRKKIVLAESIKTLGEHNVVIKLGYEVTATVKVVLTKA